MQRTALAAALLATLALSGCAGTAVAGTDGSPPAEDGAPAPPPPGPWLIVEDRITLGGPWTRQAGSLDSAGVSSVDTFWFQAPPAGTTVATRTAAAAQGPFDVDLWFHDADGRPIEAPGCATDSAEASCQVPPGAWQGRVTAALGARLRVGVWAERSPAAGP